MFSIVGFLARQILGIVGLQIEIKRIFYLVRILYQFEQMSFITRYFEKLIFPSNNWPNDARVACKVPSDFVKLIDFDFDLE
jgi:hypothetical protein